MVENLRAREIVAPTPVQAAALAELCTGRHAMVAAPTGTGKTLAFLVPLLVRMQATKKLGPLRGLVVLPTRELALQVGRRCVLCACECVNALLFPRGKGVVMLLCAYVFSRFTTLCSYLGKQHENSFRSVLKHT